MNDPETSQTVPAESGPAAGVLFVGPYPPPYGGISSHLRDITQRFSSRGISCCVLSWAPEAESDEEIAPRLRVIRARNRPTAAATTGLMGRLLKSPTLLPLMPTLGFRRFLSAASRAAVIHRQARRLGIRTVSIYGTREGDVIPFLRSWSPDLRIAFTFFADPIKREEIYRKEARFWRRAFTEADRVASSSRYCANAATRLFPAVEPEVIYVGVEVEKFTPKSHEPETDGGRVTVLFFGRMERDMGADDALEIAERVTALNPDIDFVLAGADGKLAARVTERAAASGGRIRAIVNVATDAVLPMFSAADVLIAPTVGRHACMGVSVKEGMASGIPAVVSDSGGLPEAITDQGEGFVVPLVEGKNDVDGFVTAVSRLCEDRTLRRTMGKRARQKAEELFSNDVTEERVLQLLRLA